MTPCDNCQTLIDSDTHAEELGLCLNCSNAYFTTDCETCGNFIAGDNPFSRECDTCLDKAGN